MDKKEKQEAYNRIVRRQLVLWIFGVILFLLIISAYIFGRYYFKPFEVSGRYVNVETGKSLVISEKNDKWFAQGEDGFIFSSARGRFLSEIKTQVTPFEFTMSGNKYTFQKKGDGYLMTTVNYDGIVKKDEFRRVKE